MVHRVTTQNNTIAYWVVGLGRVGSLLARLVAKNGRLRGISVRDAEDIARAQTFGEDIQIRQGPTADVGPDCIVLLCVPDDHILHVAAEWSESGAAGFVHFSGSMGLTALTARVGMLEVAAMHPLLSVSSGEMQLEEAAGVTFGLSGEGVARDAAVQLAGWLDGTVVEVDEESRAAWHLAATLASNGVYALLSVATQIAAANGISGFDVERGLAALASQSAKNASVAGSVAGATGPIVRGDAMTVAKHLQVLQHEPDGRALYVELARALIDIAEIRGVGERQLAAIRSVIESAAPPLR